jgi:hypothetical protein
VFASSKEINGKWMSAKQHEHNKGKHAGTKPELADRSMGLGKNIVPHKIMHQDKVDFNGMRKTQPQQLLKIEEGYQSLCDELSPA